MINVAIAGAAGRMGRTLIEAVSLSEAPMQVSVGTVLEEDPALGQDLGLLAGIAAIGVGAVADLEAQASRFDVLIDFTSCASTLAHLELCRRHGKAMVIGTTGFSEEEKQRIRELAQFVPVVFAPNMSVGVNLCLKLLDMAAPGRSSGIRIRQSGGSGKTKVATGDVSLPGRAEIAQGSGAADGYPPPAAGVRQPDAGMDPPYRFTRPYTADQI